MTVNDYVLVSPLVSHYQDWAKGKIVEIEDNPWRGTVIVVRMDNGDIFWDAEYHFKNIEDEQHKTDDCFVKATKEESEAFEKWLFSSISN